MAPVNGLSSTTRTSAVQSVRPAGSFSVNTTSQVTSIVDRVEISAKGRQYTEGVKNHTIEEMPSSITVARKPKHVLPCYQYAVSAYQRVMDYFGGKSAGL